MTTTTTTREVGVKEKAKEEEEEEEKTINTEVQLPSEKEKEKEEEEEEEDSGGNGNGIIFPFNCPLTEPYQALIDFVHSKRPQLIHSNFSIQYQDDESDMVTCCNNEDITAAFEAIKASGAESIRFFITLKKEEQKNSEENILNNNANEIATSHESVRFNDNNNNNNENGNDNENDNDNDDNSILDLMGQISNLSEEKQEQEQESKQQKPEGYDYEHEHEHEHEQEQEKNLEKKNETNNKKEEFSIEDIDEQHNHNINPTDLQNNNSFLKKEDSDNVEKEQLELQTSCEGNKELVDNDKEEEKMSNTWLGPGDDESKATNNEIIPGNKKNDLDDFFRNISGREDNPKTINETEENNNQQGYTGVFVEVNEKEDHENEPIVEQNIDIVKYLASMAHQHMTTKDPALGKFFVYEFISLCMDQLMKSPSEKVHIGQITKQVIEQHLDRFAIFTANTQYLTIMLPFLATFTGDELRSQLQQVLNVAKAFGIASVKLLSTQILDGASALLRGERESLDLDLTPLLNENIASDTEKEENNDAKVHDKTEESDKDETMERSLSFVPSISPIPKPDEIPPRFVVEEHIKKEKALLDQENERDNEKNDEEKEQKQPFEEVTEKNRRKKDKTIINQSSYHRNEIQRKESVHMVHKGINCNECGVVPIIGVRFTCLKCKDYDLCEQCEQLDKHDKTHPMIKMYQVCKEWSLDRMEGLQKILRDNNIPIMSNPGAMSLYQPLNYSINMKEFQKPFPVNTSIDPETEDVLSQNADPQLELEENLQDRVRDASMGQPRFDYASGQPMSRSMMPNEDMMQSMSVTMNIMQQQMKAMQEMQQKMMEESRLWMNSKNKQNIDIANAEPTIQEKNINDVKIKKEKKPDKPEGKGSMEKSRNDIAQEGLQDELERLLKEQKEREMEKSDEEKKVQSNVNLQKQKENNKNNDTIQSLVNNWNQQLEEKKKNDEKMALDVLMKSTEVNLNESHNINKRPFGGEASSRDKTPNNVLNPINSNSEEKINEPGNNLNDSQSMRPYDAVELVEQITLEDILVNSRTIMKWKIRNSGTSSLDSKCKLAFVQGDGLLVSGYHIPNCPPGESVWIGLQFNAFTTPGVYETYFRLVRDNIQFGPLLGVNIRVVDKVSNVGNNKPQNNEERNISNQQTPYTYPSATAKTPNPSMVDNSASSAMNYDGKGGYGRVDPNSSALMSSAATKNNNVPEYVTPSGKTTEGNPSQGSESWATPNAGADNKNKLLCICGRELQFMEVTKAYKPNRKVYCDLCKDQQKGSIWHCITGYDKHTHPGGFDICVTCASSQSGNQSSNSDSSKNNTNKGANSVQNNKQQQQQQGSGNAWETDRGSPYPTIKRPPDSSYGADANFPYAQQLTMLKDMGVDREKAKQLLQKYKGNIDAALGEIFGQ